LDDGYDWEQGLTDHDEKILYEVVPELWPMKEVAPTKLSFLPDFFVACYKQRKT
jgi:hypothetical protein